MLFCFADGRGKDSKLMYLRIGLCECESFGVNEMENGESCHG